MHAKSSKHLDRLHRTLAMMLGGLLAIAVFAVVSLIVARSRALPVLEPSQLAEAESTWDTRGPASYSITVQVSGLQPAVYRVEVRERVPVSAACNGNPLHDVRTWSTWSVPGMFGTVGRDLETNRRATDAGESPPLFLRARFDAQYGIPRRYLRSDERQRVATSWEVVEFQTTDEQDGSP